MCEFDLPSCYRKAFAWPDPYGFCCDPDELACRAGVAVDMSDEPIGAGHPPGCTACVRSGALAGSSNTMSGGLLTELRTDEEMSVVRLKVSVDSEFHCDDEAVCICSEESTVVTNCRHEDSWIWEIEV